MVHIEHYINNIDNHGLETHKYRLAFNTSIVITGLLLFLDFTKSTKTFYILLR